MEKQNRIKAYRWDLIVIALLVGVSLLFVGLNYLNREEGVYIEVEIGTEIVARHPLSVDGEYVLNGGTNILTVKDGVAYMTYANCPDRTCCDYRRRVHYVGQSLVCLPNGVSVTVVGTSGDSVDFVS